MARKQPPSGFDPHPGDPWHPDWSLRDKSPSTRSDDDGTEAVESSEELWWRRAVRRGDDEAAAVPEAYAALEADRVGQVVPAEARVEIPQDPGTKPRRESWLRRLRGRRTEHPAEAPEVDGAAPVPGEAAPDPELPATAAGAATEIESGEAAAAAAPEIDLSDDPLVAAALEAAVAAVSTEQAAVVDGELEVAEDGGPVGEESESAALVGSDAVEAAVASDVAAALDQPAESEAAQMPDEPATEVLLEAVAAHQREFAFGADTAAPGVGADLAFRPDAAPAPEGEAEAEPAAQLTLEPAEYASPREEARLAAAAAARARESARSAAEAAYRAAEQESAREYARMQDAVAQMRHLDAR